MMLWALPLWPILGGASLWGAARVWPHAFGRRALALSVFVVLSVSVLLSLWAAVSLPGATWDWGTPLSPQLQVTPQVGVMACLISSVALVVSVWAAAHEELEHLAQLLGLLLAFVGAMQLLVLSSDLLSVSMGFELVSALSWALIVLRARDGRAASYAFNTVRIAGLGLLIAVGAALAQDSSLAFAQLPEVARSSAASWLAAGVLIAALAKSAQLPFSPWLFRAMEGPTAASALLHSSTMVAAGAWLLIRLQPVLAQVGWFSPCVLGVGLATAIFGGLSACLQLHIKRVLAASTSAQYGLMLVAIGAGEPGAALAHLCMHALFKALLFLCAGEAIAANGGNPSLRTMQLGRALPLTAAVGMLGALALAAVPPLGAAWSKEQVLASVLPLGPWLLVLTLLAGALSAAYATRLQLLAFGRQEARQAARAPGALERTSLLVLAAGNLLSGLLFLPSVEHALSQALRIELVHASWALSGASLLTALAAVGGSVIAVRRERLDPEARTELASWLADWQGLPALIEHGVIRPVLWLADTCARFDRRVVDAGVRASAALARGLARLSATGLERAQSALISGLARLVESVASLATGVERVQNALVGALVRFAERSAYLADLTDREAVDGVVRHVAGAVTRAGRNVPRVQSGALPSYYLLIVCSLVVLGVLGWVGR